MIAPTAHLLGARYWECRAVKALAALPPHAAVVVPERAIRGYARAWCERYRADLVVLAPDVPGVPPAPVQNQDGFPGRGLL